MKLVKNLIQFGLTSKNNRKEQERAIVLTVGRQSGSVWEKSHLLMLSSILILLFFNTRMARSFIDSIAALQLKIQVWTLKASTSMLCIAKRPARETSH